MAATYMEERRRGMVRTCSDAPVAGPTRTRYGRMAMSRERRRRCHLRHWWHVTNGYIKMASSGGMSPPWRLWRSRARERSWIQTTGVAAQSFHHTDVRM